VQNGTNESADDSDRMSEVILSDLPPKSPESKPPVDEHQQSSESYRIAGAGFEFFLALIIPAAVGYWLDKRFSTAPWLVLGGLGLGFATGLVQLIRLSKRSK